MEQRVFYRQWRDEQAGSKYPFADRCALTTSDGLALAPDTFLDASLYPVGAPRRLFLAEVRLAGSLTVTLVVGDESGAEVATAAFDGLSPPAELALADRYGRPAGLLVSTPDRLAVFQTWGLGSRRFGQQAEFAAACVIPVPGDGVRGFVLADGTLFAGDVWVVGEDGVVVRRDGDRVIRVDLVGDPLFRRRLCDPADLFNTPGFIRTINGQPPDASGDFKVTVNGELAGDTILRVYPTDAGDAVRVEVVGQKAGAVADG